MNRSDQRHSRCSNGVVHVIVEGYCRALDEVVGIAERRTALFVLKYFQISDSKRKIGSNGEGVDVHVIVGAKAR